MHARVGHVQVCTITIIHLIIIHYRQPSMYYTRPTSMVMRRYHFRRAIPHDQLSGPISEVRLRATFLRFLVSGRKFTELY